MAKENSTHDPKDWPNKIVISKLPSGVFALQRYSSITKKYRGTTFDKYENAKAAAERNAKEINEEIVDLTGENPGEVRGNNPGHKKTKAQYKREAKKAQKPVKLKIVLRKGIAKSRGLFIWGVWLESSNGAAPLPAGSVEARTKEAAMKKAKAMVRKRYNILGR